MSDPKFLLIIERDAAAAAALKTMVLSGGGVDGARCVGSVAEALAAGEAAVVLFAVEEGREAEALAGAERLRERWGARVIFVGTEAAVAGLNGDGLSAVRRPVVARELALTVQAGLRLQGLESALKRAEAKRFEAQRMEGLGVMAGGVAHDFNNLLTGVYGAVEIAQQELAKDSPTRPRLEQMERSLRRAADLCQRLTVQAARVSRGARLLSVEAVAGDALEVFEAGLPAGIRVQRGPAGGALPAVRGEEAALRQMVAFVLANAAEAMGPDGGMIRVSTYFRTMEPGDLARLQLGQMAEPGGYAVIEVADTGCGIEGGNVAQIFDPLFSTKGAGRGLGLAAVTRIVRKHKGAIGVESTPGRGTAVRLFLPEAAENLAVRDVSSSSSASPMPAAGAFLVVDDDEAVRALAKWVIERAGHRVVTARDGDEALRLFAAEPAGFRLVLLDLTMPRMSGAETLAGMRALRGDVPVVLITGHGEEALLERELSGVLGHLQKPFGPEALRALLQRHATGAVPAGAR